MALVTTSVRHRRFLRRYTKLAIGAPEEFNCLGGFHQAIISIGDFAGELDPGSMEEQVLRPPRVDSRWPRHCDNCFYRFNESDRWHFFTLSLAELEK